VNSQCIYSVNNNCSFTNSLCDDGYGFVSNSSSPFSKTLNTPTATPPSIQFNVYWTNPYAATFKFYLNGNLIYTENFNSNAFSCTPTTYPSTFTIAQAAFVTYWNNNGSNTFKVVISTPGYVYLSGITVTIPNPPPASYQWSPSPD
jgi:hypothetical protein